MKKDKRSGGTKPKAGNPKQQTSATAQPAPVAQASAFNPDVLLEQAKLLHTQGNLAQAEAMYRQILAAYPAHAHALHLLGIVYHQRSQNDSAEALIRQAIAADPFNREFKNNLNIILQLQGKPKENLLPAYLAPEVHDEANGRTLKRYLPMESDTFLYVIEIAGTCNLRCPTCPVGNFTDADRPKGFMDLELFRQIVDKIKWDNVVSHPKVWLFNWGEPILHPKLPEIIAILKENGMTSMISSNLSTEKSIKEVIRAAPDEIKISLSGFSQEFYGQTHVKGDINLVKANMHLMRYYLDKFKASTRVWVGHHVYRHNAHETEALRYLCGTLNFGYSPIPAFYQPIEKMMALIEGKTPPGERAFLDKLLMHPLDHLALKKKYINPELDCELRFNMTTINYDGSVALCCGVYDYQNMLGVSFLEKSHEEIQALKYQHPFCKKCYDYGLQYSENLPGHGEEFGRIINSEIAQATAAATRQP